MNNKSINTNIGGGVEGNSVFGDAGKVEMTYKKETASVKQGKAEIEDSINKLRAMIEADSNLSKDQKEKVLEKVKMLDEAVNNPNETTKKKQAQDAKSALEGMISVLPLATKIIEECNKVLPVISKLLGLGV